MSSLTDQVLFNRLLRYATVILLLFALATFLAGQPFTAIVVLVMSSLLGALYWSEHLSLEAVPQMLARLSSLLLLAIIVLAVGDRVPALRGWTYLFPMVACVVWSLRGALMLTLFFIGLVLWLGMEPALGASRHEFLPTILLTTALSGIFVYLREFKTHQLAPLRRTDTLTQASTWEHLATDLYKEIQRSEREGTELSIILLALDPPGDNPPPTADLAALLHRVGRLLHEELRDFDSYYRVADTQFLLILPGNTTSSAIRLAEDLRRQIRSLAQRHDIATTASGGVAGLNVGDDPDSLQEKARTSLRRAQQQGGNRILSYVSQDDAEMDDRHPEDDNAEGGSNAQ